MILFHLRIRIGRALKARDWNFFLSSPKKLPSTLYFSSKLITNLLNFWPRAATTFFYENSLSAKKWQFGRRFFSFSIDHPSPWFLCISCKKIHYFELHTLENWLFWLNNFARDNENHDISRRVMETFFLPYDFSTSDEIFLSSQLTIWYLRSVDSVPRHETEPNTINHWHYYYCCNYSECFYENLRFL